MRERHLPSSRGPNVESVVRRQEFARLMIDSHQRWLRETDNQELKLIHRALIDSFQAIIEQYNVLLDVLRSGH